MCCLFPPYNPKFLFHRGNKFPKPPKIFRLRRAEKHQNFSACGGHNSIKNFPPAARSKVPKIFRLRRAEKPQKISACGGQKSPKIFRLRRAEKPQKNFACGAESQMNSLLGRRSKNMFFVCFVPIVCDIVELTLFDPCIVAYILRTSWTWHLLLSWRYHAFDPFDTLHLDGRQFSDVILEATLVTSTMRVAQISFCQPEIDPLHGASKDTLKLTRLHFWPTFERTSWNLPL